MGKYLSCMQRPEACWQGEINPKNLQAGVLRRLMFNPNFEHLKAELSGFMSKIA